jgi:hypothetical protein
MAVIASGDPSIVTPDIGAKHSCLPNLKCREQLAALVWLHHRPSPLSAAGGTGTTKSFTDAVIKTLKP